MDNKYLKIALVLPLLTALLCGCSQTDEYPDTGISGAGHRPLGIASLSAPGAAPQTRTTTTPLPTDGEVGFFLLADAPHYSAVNNKKGVYKADESLWLPVDSIWLSKATAKLAVYYPYDAAQTTAGKLNLKAAVRTDDTKDLCSARFEANSRTKDIKLTLTQLYSRLSITFVKLTDVEYTGTSALTQIKLAGTGIYAGATYDPQDGTYTYGTAGYTASLTGITIKGTNAAANDATKVDLLLPPYATLTGDITLTATVDTKEMKITIPKAKLSNTLAAGKQYNITIKLKPTALVLGSIQTTDWDSQTAWNEEATFMPEIPPVDLGLPFVIASGNLTAAPNVSGGYIYSFAEDQGYYSGKGGSDGDYYCWNTPNPNLDNETQSAWDDARDACRQVDGGEWYTPSIKQWRLMLGKGSVWGTYAAGSGTKNGYYIGTSSIPSEAEQNKFLFLPASGARYAGDSWSGDDNTMAYYWSSTVDDAGYNAAYAIFLVKTEISEQTTDRYYGFSLRCVKDKPLEPIDIGLDFLIAPGNVRATSDGAGGYTYAFAKDQESENIGNSGDYFCFDEIDPLVEIPEKGWGPDDYTTQKDPCKLVGAGWYTPTIKQMEELYKCSRGYFNGTWEQADGNKVAGMYIGTASQPDKDEQKKYVFLPYLGLRSSLSYPSSSYGISGYYMTCEARGGNQMLFIKPKNPDYGQPIFEVAGYDSVTYGLPIRCVRDK